MNAQFQLNSLILPLGLLLLSFGFVLSIGCAKEGRGFALPPGDAERGEVYFTALKCNTCHSVGDINWIGSVDDAHVPLGGKTTRVKTYGELVASVINPSHKISKAYLQNTADSLGKSKMVNYNQLMTVQELVDIVTFLQDKYEVYYPQDNTYYPHYY